MEEEKQTDKKSAAENFGDMLKEFGSAVAEIFNDPQLKTKLGNLEKAPRNLEKHLLQDLRMMK